MNGIYYDLATKFLAINPICAMLTTRLETSPFCPPSESSCIFSTRYSIIYNPPSEVQYQLEAVASGLMLIFIISPVISSNLIGYIPSAGTIVEVSLANTMNSRLNCTRRYTSFLSVSFFLLFFRGGRGGNLTRS